MAKVAFLGLGAMGFPMAAHLRQRGGHEVTVHNRNRAKAEHWVARHGGRLAETPDAAAEGQDFVFACVGTDDDLRAVTLGADGAFRGMAAGAVFVDHTTASADIAREFHAIARRRGFDFIDAPVSGGQVGAEAGRLTVMAGGDAEPFARAAGVMGSYAKYCSLMGDAGAGQLAKMANQICVAGAAQGLAEGLHFASRAGLDIGKLVETMSQGAAQSWQMDTRCAKVDEGAWTFGLAADALLRKDLAIGLAEARRNGARLPIAALVAQFFAEAQRQDASDLLARLEHEAGTRAG